MSSASWKPNALPRSFFSTEPASIAERIGCRSPRPIQASERATITCGQLVMATRRPRPKTVAPYPPTASLLRHAMRSLYQPLQSLTTADEPSPMPSTRPTANAGAPRPTVMNSGRTAKTIS